MDTDEQNPVGQSGDTNSGMPNPADPNEGSSTEHKSGYGGEAGEPRTSSDKKQQG